jgi:hypothetical protein
VSGPDYPAAVASDIVPIQLSLPEGDLITLWAPSWREDGEEWEGWLGDEEAVHAFPDAGMLMAYVRTAAEHDLSDHPAWPLVPRLPAADLVPAEDQCYDLVGVPELAAAEPDTWLVGELAGITAVLRSLAGACELDAVHEVLASTEAFAALDKGSWAFSGRSGTRLWAELGTAVQERWAEVLAALGAVVRVPEVDAAAVAAARREFAPDDGEPGAPVPAAEPDGPSDSAAAAFWADVGIDPVLVSLDDGDYYTLRSYLDDAPVFLGTDGRIDVLPSAEALARYLGREPARAGHDLAGVSTWRRVLARAAAGELVVEIDPQNVYTLSGLAEDIAEGPGEVDPHELDLAVELLLDVGEWAGDESAHIALSRSQSLGWFASCVLKPDVTRLAPSPPFDAEVRRWNGLVSELRDRLRRR